MHLQPRRDQSWQNRQLGFSRMSNQKCFETGGCTDRCIMHEKVDGNSDKCGLNTSV